MYFLFKKTWSNPREYKQLLELFNCQLSPDCIVKKQRIDIMFKCVLNIEKYGRELGLVVIGDDSCLKGNGFELWRRILGGQLFTLICFKIVLFV